MNPISTLFLAAASFALLSLPRRLAPVPLLIGACYMTLAQGVNVGPFTFSVLRILVAVGVLRVLFRRETLVGGLNKLDSLMWSSAVVAIVTSPFHQDPKGQLIFCLGMAYNTCGIYFLFRTLCRSVEDAVGVIQATAFVLVPVALEMLLEVGTRQNLFAALGGVPEVPEIREGRVRAQGPFAHSILAGTVGAVCVPMMVGLWRLHRTASAMGLAACVTMVITSASSGPIASVGAGLVALAMWKCRNDMRSVRWLLVSVYALLALVMKAPPYALIGRIDLAGGSAGWHRVELIDAAKAHFNEWWLWGTDYTRHWMPTGVTWSPDHTDITNYYLHLGVVGGVPLIMVFVWTLVQGYSFTGRSIRHSSLPVKFRFVAWSLGAALFAHTATCISVSYFDQSFLFLYLTLAVIGAVYSSLVVTPVSGLLSSAQMNQSCSTAKGVQGRRWMWAGSA